MSTQTKTETPKQQDKNAVRTTLSKSTETSGEMNERDLEQVKGGINWGDGRIDPYK